MIRYEKSIVVDAPVEQVFAYLNDPTREPEYRSGVDEVKDIQRLPDGRYTFREVNKFLGLHMDETVEVTEVIPEERIAGKMRGAGVDGIFTERFELLEDGKTRVSIVGEATLHAGPLAKFGESFLTKYMDHSTEMAMEAAKAHIEAAARAAMPS